MPPNSRPRSYRLSEKQRSLRKGSYIKGSRAKTLEKKERRDYLHETLFAEGSDPFQEEEIPLPPPRPKNRRQSPKHPRSSKRISSSPTPNSDRKSGSRSPSRTLSRRKSLSFKGVKGEQSDAPKNHAGKSRKMTRRFSLKPKKKDAASVDGSLSSKKSEQSDDEDRRKTLKTRSKSDGGVLAAMKNSLQIASDSEASEKEEEDDDEGPGLLSRGLHRLEQFYEESLNG